MLLLRNSTQSRLGQPVELYVFSFLFFCPENDDADLVARPTLLLGFFDFGFVSLGFFVLYDDFCRFPFRPLGSSASSTSLDLEKKRK